MAEIEEIKPPLNPIGILVVIGLVFLLSGISSTFYTVEPEEEAVILRFGKMSRVSGPGLNFKLPFGLEELHRVKTARIFKSEFGFRTIAPGIRTQYQKRGYEEESLLLTGDLNVIDVEWVVQYQVVDPVKYLFNVRDVESSIRDVSESVMRRVIGDRTFDEILSDRNEVAEKVREEMQKVLSSYECGIKILTVKLQDVNPPNKVKPAFNEVNEAIQEKEKYINEAQEIYNKQIPKAKGEARRSISQSEGYARERINEAQGNISRFNAVYLEYKKAKEITKKRLYLEAMEEMLAKVDRVYIVDKNKDNLLPFINFGGRKDESRKGARE